MVRRPAPAVAWVRLVLAALATALCEASALALTATAAWLVCRAFEQPPLAALSLAVVAVRALALVRGTLRYGERLAGVSIQRQTQAAGQHVMHTGGVGQPGG
ncbi:hypothetical protein [Streptomyces sp. NPDC001401]|uniref:hypothetical protein n=1 Tax=Streptomyces sp. NPDC001401 TaxID=3364570 RepID=UPI00369D83F5